MVRLENSNADFFNLTFHNKDLHKRFIKSYYPKYKINVKIKDRVYDIDKEEDAIAASFDHAKESITVNFYNDKSRYSRNVYASQFLAQCSSVIITTDDCIVDKDQTMLEDLFYLLGYTVVFISFRPTRGLTLLESFTKAGYNPICQGKNKRSGNEIAIMFKELKLCL